jgi:hypothetical protein
MPQDPSPQPDPVVIPGQDPAAPPPGPEVPSPSLPPETGPDVVAPAEAPDAPSLPEL